MKEASLSGVLAGVFLFAFTGTWLVLFQGFAGVNLDQIMSGSGASNSLIQLQVYWFVFWFFVAAVGFITGYTRNFPSWSYAYAGLFILLGLFIVWSYSDRVDIWMGDLFPPSTRAMLSPWIILAPLVICLALTRSLRPLGRFFTNLDRDASQLSFAFFAGWPILLWLTYVDDHSPLNSLFLLFHAILLVLTAFFYLRSTTIWRRTAALAVGTVGNLLLMDLMALASWAENDPAALLPMASGSIVISMIILLPALLGSLYALLEPSRRSVGAGMEAER